MSPNTEPLLSVRALAKRHGTHQALDGVSFDLAPASVNALVGRNGAGKTTLLECVLGLREPDAGSVRLLGAELRGAAPALRGRIGAVLHDGGFQALLTVEEALRHEAALRGCAPPPDSLLERLGLLEKRRSRTAALSTGERQRLQLAAALLHRPSLLVLDEATGGLDPEGRALVDRLLLDLRSEGACVLLCTHDLGGLASGADQVLVLERGRLAAAGSPAALLAAARLPHRLALRATRPFVASDLAGLPGLCDEEAPAGAPDRRELGTHEPEACIQLLATRLAARGATLAELRLRPPSLADLFPSAGAAAQAAAPASRGGRP